MIGNPERLAVVSGASSGIGRAIAAGLAGQGATVVLLGRKPDTLSAVAEELGDRGLVQRADVTVDTDIAEVATRLRDEWGRVDVLVHSAGVHALGSLADAPVHDLDWHYATNVRGPYALTRALLPLIRACRGQIVFVNSSAGLRATRRAGPYAASKHALRAMADSLRDEVNEDGVRVLSVFVGRTATPMQAAVHAAEGTPYRPERLLQPADVARIVVSALGLPPTAEVTDLFIRPLAAPLRAP